MGQPGRHFTGSLETSGFLTARTAQHLDDYRQVPVTIDAFVGMRDTTRV